MKKIILIISASIAFYAAKITSFSPIYLIYMVAMPLALVVIFKKKKIHITLDMLIAGILLFYILLTQFVNFKDGGFINIVTGLAGYWIIRANRGALDNNQLLKTFGYCLWITIIVISADSLYRLTHLGSLDEEAFKILSESESLWFYLYKVNSLSFSDSNTTGLIALILYFSAVEIEKSCVNGQERYELAKLILILLILGSLSRSAIIAFIFGYLNSIFFSKNVGKRLFYIFGLLLFVLIGLILSYSSLLKDGSFATKIDLLFNTIKILVELSPYELVFGIGLGHAPEVLGRAAHLLFLTYFLELGLVGLIIFMAFIGRYIYKYGSLIWLPVLVASLSYFFYAGAPFLFIPLALTANYKELQRKMILKLSLQ